LEKKDKKPSIEYWKRYINGYRRLAGIPRTKLFHRGDEQYALDEQVFLLDSNIVSVIDERLSRLKVTWSIFIQTIWAILLSKYNLVNDVVFGMVVSGRPTEIENAETMIGLFINTIPVRIALAPNTSFDVLLNETQRNAILSEPHHFCQLAEIQSLSTLSKNLLDHLLIFDNYPLADQIKGAVKEQGADTADNISVLSVESFEQTNYDLNLLINLGQTIAVRFKYNSNVYNAECIRHIWNSFALLIHQIQTKFDLAINDMSIIPQEDIHTLAASNTTSKELLLRLQNQMGWKNTAPADQRVYVLDEEGVLVPPGVLGNVYLSGDSPPSSLSNSVPNNIKPATEFFVLEDTIFFTGYVGRWRFDSTLELLGKKSDCFIIEGCIINVECIENRLQQFRGVQAVKVVSIDRADEEGLVAFYTAEQLIETSELKGFLAQTLPEHMIPYRFEWFKKMPLLRDGSIDLDVLELNAKNLPQANGTPSTPLEEELFAIWSEVLNVDKIGVHDNFFKITGNSVKATQIVSRMHRAGFKITLRTIFTYPTIYELATLLSVSSKLKRDLSELT
jgi:non-ribosomal peptide synthetase component F/aryl carrier-like protein